MKVLTKKLTRVFVSVAILSGIQIIVGTANSKAQSVEDQGNQVIQEVIKSEQRHISQLSCPQLIAEAEELTKKGDRWAAQVNVPYYASRAEGAYASAERRNAEYNRRC